MGDCVLSWIAPGGVGDAPAKGVHKGVRQQWKGGGARLMQAVEEIKELHG